MNGFAICADLVTAAVSEASQLICFESPQFAIVSPRSDRSLRRGIISMWTCGTEREREKRKTKGDEGTNLFDLRLLAIEAEPKARRRGTEAESEARRVVCAS